MRAPRRQSAARARQSALGGEQVEGYHAVRQLLAAGERRADRLWIAGERPMAGPLAEIAGLAKDRGTPIVWTSPEALAAAARTGAPQGVIAWAEPVAALSLDEVLASPAHAESFLVVLDGVTDPGNFGAILRTAACAGVTGVVIGRHRSAPLTPAAVKAAAGAAEVVPIAVVPGIPSAIAQVSKSGVWAVGLVPTAPDDLWHSRLLDGPVALVLGAEGRGLSQLARQRCDALVRVPQSSVLSSLNVAAAGAIACFEVARRRWARRGPDG